MARFDYYQFGSTLLLDVQADLLERLNTRMVVPLLPEDEAPKPAEHLNPAFIVAGRKMVMATQFMAAVPLAELGKPAGSLAHAYDTIKPAIDFLFDGF